MGRGLDFVIFRPLKRIFSLLNDYFSKCNWFSWKTIIAFCNKLIDTMYVQGLDPIFFSGSGSSCPKVPDRQNSTLNVAKVCLEFATYDIQLPDIYVSNFLLLKSNIS